MKELSLAISEENLGGAVICFTDESYVNVRHKIQFTWFSPLSPQRNEVGGPSGRGEREILLHAICKFGLIGDDISGRAEASDLKKSLPSAQHFFVGGYIGEDYHKNIDGDFFIQWLLHRFIPAFDVKFPHKKCILVLDNAPYHHAKDAEFIKLGGSKAEIIEGLRKLNVDTIDVRREGRVKRMNSSTWNHRRSLYAPSTSELLDALKVAVASHPESQLSAVQKIFNQRGWQLIFTPPYTPQCQPIEKVWAYVKHHIASLFEPHRNAAVLLSQTILAFYGDPFSDWPGVTEEFCQSLINHSYKWCNQFIDMHMKEGGNLFTLAAHLSENPIEEAVSVEIEDEVEGAREEGENEVYDVYDFDNSLNEQ
jgi:transposase